MREKIDCFLPCDDCSVLEHTLDILRGNNTIQHIHLLVTADFAKSHQVPKDCTFVETDGLLSTQTIRNIDRYARCRIHPIESEDHSLRAGSLCP
jgi:hypothetical protein